MSLSRKRQEIARHFGVKDRVLTKSRGWIGRDRLSRALRRGPTGHVALCLGNRGGRNGEACDELVLAASLRWLETTWTTWNVLSSELAYQVRRCVTPRGARPGGTTLKPSMDRPRHPQVIRP